MSKKILSVLALSLAPAVALAHPGHGDAGFVNAFAHPFTGIDHLLMMLCVGVWAGRIGGRARWQLPATFLSAMLVGWVLGAQGFVIAGVETGIAASLIALGVLFIARATLSRALQLAIIASFALLHGMAHSAELGAETPLLSAAGFLGAGALLHVSGIALTALLPKHNAAIYRGLGAVLALVGGGLLVAA
jgi:urease accessory protein